MLPLLRSLRLIIKTKIDLVNCLFLKTSLTLTLLFTTVINITSQAQQVKPYMVVVTTNVGKERGILYRADSAKVVIDARNGFVNIKTQDIEKIKIKRVKSGDYEIKSYVKYSDWEERNFEKTASGMRMLKPGVKEPTLKEEISRRAGFTIINTFLNIIVLPFHAINPAVNVFRYKSSQEFKSNLDNLNHYSIFYQANLGLIKLQPLK
jgi:hypothetical protein